MVKRDGYRSYLLRIWKAGEADKDWRITLQDTLTSSQVILLDLEDLADYLRDRMRRASPLEERRKTPRTK